MCLDIQKYIEPIEKKDIQKYIELIERKLMGN